jgi:anti-anti-sigma regulatory factor
MRGTPSTQRSPASTSDAKFLLKEGILTLQANLHRADYNGFQQACNQLRTSPVKTVRLDLTKCTYVSSLFIGLLVDVVTQMKADGKDVTVHVSPEVGRFLHMAHLYHLFAYTIVDPPTEERSNET